MTSLEDKFTPEDVIFLKSLRIAIQEVDLEICSGSIPTFDLYKSRTGFRAGLIYALEKFHERVKHERNSC